MPVLESVGVNEFSALSSDPRLGGSALHPNLDGAPVVCRWREMPGVPGNALFFHDVTFGVPQWAGRMEVTLSVYQVGAGPTHRTLQITSQNRRIGIAVWLATDRYTYEISLRLLSDHYEGSVVGIGPLTLDYPVPETSAPAKVFQLAGARKGGHGAPRRDKAIVSCNQGGLMNRLYPMLSTVYAARKTGRSAYVYWGGNAHCAADFADLFEVGSAGVEAVDASFIADSFERHSRYQGEPPPMPLSNRTMLVHSIAPYPTEASTTPTNPELAAIFRTLNPSAAVRRRLAQFDNVDFSKTIAFHIRRAYPNGAFSELERSKFGIGEEVFFSLLENLRRSFPEYARAFVCTNDLGTEARLKAQFGDYIFTSEKTTIDNTTEPAAVQEAMVDLILMSRCPVVFTQSATTFGQFAHTLGGNAMVELVTRGDGMGKMFKVRIEGSVVAELETQDEITAIRRWVPEAPGA